MKTFALAAVVALSTLSLSMAANAMPALQAAPSDTGITQVEGGCGPGYHRSPYGRCIPGGYGSRPGYRACPPGLRLNRYGHCRPY